MAQRNPEQQIVRLIRDHWPVDAVYLYGSRAKGLARADSDWDIAVLFRDFLPSTLERVLRPQEVEAYLQRELDLYDQLSVVDLEAVPPPLQFNIIQGIKLYDRGIPHVRRVEGSILSKIEKQASRDLLYEQELHKHIDRMAGILGDYRTAIHDWTEKDSLGVQRALQVLIEALIGLARYAVEQRYTLRLSRSREAVDALRRKGVLDEAEHRQALKMIGFRNVLVHDYLNVDDDIVKAIVDKGDYQGVIALADKLQAFVEKGSGP